VLRLVVCESKVVPSRLCAVPAPRRDVHSHWTHRVDDEPKSTDIAVFATATQISDYNTIAITPKFDRTTRIRVSALYSGAWLMGRQIPPDHAWLAH